MMEQWNPLGMIGIITGNEDRLPVLTNLQLSIFLWQCVGGTPPSASFAGIAKFGKEQIGINRTTLCL
jgi:hypothetical protein